MKTLVIETKEQLEAALNENRSLVFDGDLVISVDILYGDFVSDIIARGYISDNCDIRASGGK